MTEIMKPHMSAAKIDLLNNSLARASHYLEYGIGGSTILAAQKSLQSIIAIDSSKEWINKVKTDIEKFAYSGSISLLHANLGTTADWGYPIDESMVKHWPQYYASPWITYRASGQSPDLILIDGRFRIPCFLYSLIHCKPGTRILWDDYHNRPEYHFVENVLVPQGLVDDMAIFSASEDIDKKLANIFLFENIFNLD
jgi:hypothetical protein